jgi:hypothetical protein
VAGGIGGRRGCLAERVDQGRGPRVVHVRGKNLDQPQYGGESDLSLSWVNRYAAYLSSSRPGSAVVNLSKPGYGTFHALPTGTTNPAGRPAVDPTLNVTRAIAEETDAVIIAYPSGGDLDAGVSIDAILTNLHTIADAAEAAGAAAWVTTPNPRGSVTVAQRTTTSSFRTRVLSDFGDRAIDFYTPRAAPDGTPLPEYTLTDDTHPNAEGHRLLFELVVEADVPRVALP